MSNNDFSFSSFARHPFYTDLNSHLVEQARIQPGQVVVDLACGTGAVSQLILEKLRGARESLLIATDASAAALRQAKQELDNARSTVIQFVQGNAEQLSETVQQNVDTVFLCNAIHLVPNKCQLLEEVKRILLPGGIFAFNSAFFRGTNPAETELFYRRWIMRAQRILRHQYQLAPERAAKVEARKHLSEEDYVVLLRNHGFTIRESSIQKAQMPLEAWLDICSFKDFISGIMPGVPLFQASSALKQAVDQVFSELKLQTVCRNWLEIIAIRQ